MTDVAQTAPSEVRVARPPTRVGGVDGRRAERAQLAGARCKASDELIAFEKDARLCGRCGEVYHKSHVPDRCLTCDAALK